jgi:GntR family transcriptional regulator
MFVRIESLSGVPITRQIADQIRTKCASGALAPGDRLPSVRALAEELAVNQNTILRVYERLTMEGLLERRHGDGTYVAPRQPAGQLKAQHELLRDEVERLARRAAELGVEAPQVRKLLEEAMARVAPRKGTSKGAEHA